MLVPVKLARFTLPKSRIIAMLYIDPRCDVLYILAAIRAKNLCNVFCAQLNWCF